MAWRQILLVAAISALLPIGSAWAGGDLGGGERVERVARAERACSALLSAEGCYWNRGRRYCSRYCYIEVNGRRYCNPRESEAVPQAGCEAWERPEPVYRRARHRRYRRD